MFPIILILCKYNTGTTSYIKQLLNPQPTAFCLLQVILLFLSDYLNLFVIGYKDYPVIQLLKNIYPNNLNINPNEINKWIEKKKVSFVL